MKINNITVADPSALSLTLSDTEGSSYTNARGNTIRDLVRVNQRTVDVEWQYLTKEQTQAILENCIAGAYVTLTYFDALSNQEETKTFKVSSRSIKYYSLNADLPPYGTISMTFEEQ